MFEQVESHHAAVESAPAGASSVWETFTRTHHRVVSRCVGRAMARVGWTPRADEVEELAQEVYCRLLERSDSRVSGRPEGQLWSYLQRIAYSVVVDHLRARHARKRGGWPPPGDTGPRRPGIADGPAPGLSPEERLLTRERARDVRRRVRQAFPGRIGERNLSVLEMAAVEGLTAAEIAERLRGELTASSVHTLLHRLRRLLASAPSGAPLAAAG
jgi:RNA polymerase sigma factor (sigma-70 family)